jgi:RNase P/RNase MRP subunit p29
VISTSDAHERARHKKTLVAKQKSAMEAFFGRVMRVTGEDRRIEPAGVYHLLRYKPGTGGRSAAGKAARSERRRSRRVVARKLSHRQLKLEGMYDFSLNGRRYKDFLPIHSLWLQYMAAVLSKYGPTASLEQVGAKVLKADWHGAFVTVLQSATPSQVGHAGIVLVERRNTFLIVTKKSELLLLSKAGTLFAMRLNNMVLKLNGDGVRVRSSERAVHKFRRRA